MTSTAYTTCSLCEAMCGLVVEHTGNRAVRIAGDREDPFSRGHLCPKAVALMDLHQDPDRLRRPLRRTGPSWTEVSWKEALDEAAEGLREVQRKHGRNAVAAFVGNPAVGDYGALLFGLMLLEALRTRNMFTANSVDALPRLLVSYLLYGSWALAPIPDIDRTDFMLIIGANPVVSNGSVMAAPGARKRLRAIRERGGKVIVIDPRRTETAELAGMHHFVRPGTDALLLLAMLHTLFDRGLAKPGRIEAFVDGVDRVRELAARFPPARVAGVVGIPAEAILALTTEFAGARSAVCYGRMGTSTQEFGTLSSWLIDALNILTGNLDRAGGAMFARPAADLARISAALGQSGAFGRWRSRVSGFAEFNGELPVAALAEEIEIAGDGQIRGLFVFAGNPVLSTPNGRRLERALEKLDFMVSVDIYLNETSRCANLILPPTVGLERDHYGLVYHGFGTRNTAKYARPVLKPPVGALHDWQIALELTSRLIPLGALLRTLGSVLTPRTLLKAALRFGPYGAGLHPFRHGLSLSSLEASPHGIDLGPLLPRLPDVLRTREKRIRLAPEELLGDVPRLEARIGRWEAEISDTAAGDALLLIGRREVRTNNSWMHNSPRLMKGDRRCTLLIHPDDARGRGIADGTMVTVRSRVGAVDVEARLSDEVMRGIVSLPFGWGHNRPGMRLRVAQRNPGVSPNDLTDENLVDSLSGCTNINGVPVSVAPARSART